MRTYLTDAVLKVMMRLGRCTVGQVTAEVGHLVSAARANHRNKTCPNGAGRYAKLLSTGRRRLVADALRSITRSGKIIRVERGVYAIKRPKLFVPNAC